MAVGVVVVVVVVVAVVCVRMCPGVYVRGRQWWWFRRLGTGKDRSLLK